MTIFRIANWPNPCGSGLCTLRGNIFNFTSPDEHYHLVVDEDSSSVALIDASYSFWGTSDEANLTHTIFGELS